MPGDVESYLLINILIWKMIGKTQWFGLPLWLHEKYDSCIVGAILIYEYNFNNNPSSCLQSMQYNKFFGNGLSSVLPNNAQYFGLRTVSISATITKTNETVNPITYKVCTQLQIKLQSLLVFHFTQFSQSSEKWKAVGIGMSCLYRHQHYTKKYKSYYCMNIALQFRLHNFICCSMDGEPICYRKHCPTLLHPIMNDHCWNWAIYLHINGQKLLWS